MRSCHDVALPWVWWPPFRTGRPGDDVDATNKHRHANLSLHDYQETNNKLILMKHPLSAVALISTLGFCGLQQATAGVVGVDLGTGLPPASLGGYAMSPYDPGSIGGQDYYAHLTNGNDDGTGTGGWATWGQNYTGNVYVSLGASPLTLDLSGNVEAVYFYEEPNQFADFYMTAKDSSGVSVTTLINGFHGSAGVGFYVDVPGGPYLTQISVTSSDPTGFAIGEFGLSGGTLTGHVPDAGASLLLMGISVSGLLAVRRFTRGAV